MHTETKSYKSANDIRAFLEEGSELEGNLKFTGVVRVNGVFRGEIHSDDLLIIGPSARIEGNIHVGALILGGRFSGEVVAKNRIEVLPTGKLFGTASSPVLVTHEGAQIEGHLQIQMMPTKETTKAS